MTTTYHGFKSPINQGDVLAYWHDTVAFGVKLAYARVVRLGNKKVRVSYETSHDEAWVYPHKFDHVVAPQTVAELIADGVDV